MIEYVAGRNEIVSRNREVSRNGRSCRNGIMNRNCRVKGTEEYKETKATGINGRTQKKE
jgi:hypothetical protein